MKTLKVKTTLKSKGSDVLQKVARNIERVKGSYVTIGVHAGGKPYKEYPPKKPCAEPREPKVMPEVWQVAMWNEFGTKTAPARPFLRNTWYGRADKIREILQTELRKIMMGKKSPDTGLDAIGEQIESLIRSTIKRGKFAKNAARTLALKRERYQGQRPLIASRTLVDSISHQVHMRK